MNFYVVLLMPYNCANTQHKNTKITLQLWSELTEHIRLPTSGLCCTVSEILLLV